jgi:hypothetical protein
MTVQTEATSIDFKQIAFDYRVNDLYRLYPNTTTEFRAHIVKSMGDVDALGYAKEFFRLKKQIDILKAYEESKPVEVEAEPIDRTREILEAKYGKK